MILEKGFYELYTPKESNWNKSVIFVKLTDSALRAVEEYVRCKKDDSSKLTIQFEKNDGVIRLLVNGNSQAYNFNLSNVEADELQGSFECLQQTGEKCLKLQGCMSMKIQIHAKEDSYAKLKVNVAASEQEHKMFCTKEIKSSVSRLGHTLKRHVPVVSCLRTNPLPNPHKSFPKHKFASSPDILKQTIRDRIIHILAIKQYKRPELLLRLITEGITENDRKEFPSILSQVSTIKGNAYTLANDLWKEVQEDWKFCTEEELGILRKRRQQFLNSKLQLESSASPLQIKPFTPTNHLEPHTKKERITHFAQRENCSITKNNPDSLVQINGKCNDYKPASTPENKCAAYARRSQQVLNSTPQLESSASPLHIEPFTPANYLEPHTKKQRISHYAQRENCSSTKNLLDSLVQINGKHSDYNPTSIPNNKCSEYSRKQPQFLKSKTKPDVCSYMQKNTKLIPAANILQKRHAKGQIASGSVNAKNINCVGYNPSQMNGQCSNESQLVSSSNNDCQAYVKNQKKKKSKKRSKSRNKRRRSKRKQTKPIPAINSQKQQANEQVSSYRHAGNINCMSNNPTQMNRQCSNETQPTSSSNDDCQDYAKIYTRIESSEQKAQYEADFASQYGEYMWFYSKIKGPSAKLTALVDYVRTMEEGSEEFKQYKSISYNTCQAYQQNQSNMDALKRFNYLHFKLLHIKRLLMEYGSAS